jgi:calcineurin-like phosphoesterase family protein
MIKSLYPKFQHWSEKGAIWIISDPHLDYDNKLINSYWPTSQQYIQNLHSHVGKNDTLICLGDVGNKEYFRDFKCYKVLITGNHDAGATTYTDVFDEVYEGPLFIADRILLSHEPIFGLEEMCVNIHGHVHCETNIYVNHINLAADNVNFEPFNLGQAIKNGLLSSIKNYHKLALEKIKKL